VKPGSIRKEFKLFFAGFLLTHSTSKLIFFSHPLNFFPLSSVLRAHCCELSAMSSFSSPSHLLSLSTSFLCHLSSGFWVKGSAQPPAKKTAGQIEKETDEHRTSNVQHRTSNSGSLSPCFRYTLRASWLRLRSRRKRATPEKPPLVLSPPRYVFTAQTPPQGTPPSRLY
jgi:hypothetical protein